MKHKIDRFFKLWAYSVSHSTLIIRSEKQYEDVIYDKVYENNVTVDIEFSGVNYMDIPSVFKHLNIEKIDGDMPSKFSQEIRQGTKLYCLNNSFYILASSCIIGESTWSIEDRIHDMSLKYQKELIL